MLKPIMPCIRSLIHRGYKKARKWFPYLNDFSQEALTAPLSPTQDDMAEIATAFLLLLLLLNAWFCKLSCNFFAFQSAALGSETAPPWEGEGRAWTQRLSSKAWQSQQCPAGTQLDGGCCTVTCRGLSTKTSLLEQPRRNCTIARYILLFTTK